MRIQVVEAKIEVRYSTVGLELNGWDTLKGLIYHLNMDISNSTKPTELKE